MAERRRTSELELEPRLKIKRLNRLAVLLVAGVAIVVLWVAYFVLSQRSPVASEEREARSPGPALTLERAALERLQRQARAQAELQRVPPPAAALRPTAPPPAQPPPPPDPRVVRVRQRLERAYDAEVLAAAFRHTGTSGQEERPTRSSFEELERANFENPSSLTAFDGGEFESPSVLTAFGSDRAGLDSAGASGPTNPLDHATRHEAFLRQAADRRRASWSPALARQSSPFVLQEGSLIPAILTAGIHSDLPGQTTALVRRDVYDSTTGRHLLIPQGSRLVGSYDNRVARGQKRVLFAWHRLIFPDGRSLDLRGMPGADLAAMAGVRDRVNNHFVRTFGSALLLSAISAGTQLSQPQESSQGGSPSARQIAAAALGQELGRTSTEITRRNVGVQPTLRIRPGFLFHVEVTADLELPGPWAQERGP